MPPNPPCPARARQGQRTGWVRSGGARRRPPFPARAPGQRSQKGAAPPPRRKPGVAEPALSATALAALFRSMLQETAGQDEGEKHHPWHTEGATHLARTREACKTTSTSHSLPVQRGLRQGCLHLWCPVPAAKEASPGRKGNAALPPPFPPCRELLPLGTDQGATQRPKGTGESGHRKS